MLIDLDEETNNKEIIYFNNDAHNVSDSSHISSRIFREQIEPEEQLESWGTYPFKPVAQSAWDDLVEACLVGYEAAC